MANDLYTVIRNGWILTEFWFNLSPDSIIHAVESPWEIYLNRREASLKKKEKKW